MGRLEERLRRLEEVLIEAPTLKEYLDARNREGIRALRKLTELLVPHGFDGGYLFGEETLRMLAADTPDDRKQDREILEAWYRAQGRNRAAEVEGAEERLLTKLEARGKE